MKFGEAFTKGMAFIIETAGEAIIKADEDRKKHVDQLVEMKNREVEREANQNRIIKGDIDNLRNHVAKIVQDENTPEDVRKKGKELLKSEGGWLFEDTYTCEKYYKFVIDHGL